MRLLTLFVVPFVVTGLAEPASDYCILTWIQGHLATSRGTDFPTLPELYANATRDTPGGNLRKRLWASLTPRTTMFRRFFDLLKASTHRFEVVEAMHKCGFTPQVLETLPEAILTTLQDVISICQPNPPPSWPKDLLRLINRTDMTAVLRSGKTLRMLASDINVSTSSDSAPNHVLIVA